MKKDKDIYHILYILAVAVMTVIYFSVPERGAFLEYQIQWWAEMWDVIKDFM